VAGTGLPVLIQNCSIAFFSKIFFLAKIEVSAQMWGEVNSYLLKDDEDLQHKIN